MRAALKLVERAAQLQKKTLIQGSSYLKGAAAGAQQQQIRQLGQDSGSSSIYTRQTRSVSLGPSSQSQQQQKAEATVSPRELVDRDLNTMFQEIHQELEYQLEENSELRDMAKYYFDGQGKAIRPVIALCVGHAYNAHNGAVDNLDIKKKQRLVAIVSEMIHTASLVHDDVLDHAETRRGKASVNMVWNSLKSTHCGDYILAVCSRLMAKIDNTEVIVLLSRVLTDLVQGELMQMQNKVEENERFEAYLQKSFNKTASLMAYSCQANAVLAGETLEKSHSAFLYGKHVGIAFQLVDDLLDFVSSSEQLGKPAAADLELGLATAPVLFATKEFPELNDMIARRFSEPGDVERAFECAVSSGGLAETKKLAGQHCEAALDAIRDLNDSIYKNTLFTICDTILNRLK